LTDYGNIATSLGDGSKERRQGFLHTDLELLEKRIAADDSTSQPWIVVWIVCIGVVEVVHLILALVTVNNATVAPFELRAVWPKRRSHEPGLQLIGSLVVPTDRCEISEKGADFLLSLLPGRD
jgi:hypothetical protein